MSALHAALADVAERQGWLKREDAVKRHGPQAIDGLLSHDFARIDHADDTLVLTEAGLRAHKAVRS